MLVDVLVGLLSWVKGRLLEKALLMDKVIFIFLQAGGKEDIVITVGLQLFKTSKQRLVLIVHVRILKQISIRNDIKMIIILN